MASSRSIRLKTASSINPHQKPDCWSLIIRGTIRWACLFYADFGAELPLLDLRFPKLKTLDLQSKKGGIVVTPSILAGLAPHLANLERLVIFPP